MYGNADKCGLVRICPQNYHIVNTFFTSLDTVLAEIENRFSGNDQGVICALGGVTLIPPPSDGFDLVSRQGETDACSID